MKKIIAVILLLGMLLPMGIVSSVNGAQIEKMPFYLVNWQDDVTDYDNIYMMVDLNASYKEGADSVTLSINWQGERSSDIAKIAQIVKAEFDNRPEGARYINYPLAIDSIIFPEAMIYLDKAVALFKDWNEKFFAEYKRIGGKLDGVILDVEYSEIGAYYINKAYKGGAALKDEEEGTSVSLTAYKNVYLDIVNHPLYPALRAQLAERGFKFSTPSGDKSEVFSSSVRPSAEYDIWNAVMRNRMCAYINEACAPILNYFPEVTISNYRFPSGKEWQESVSQTGGFGVGGNTPYAGNTANENFYLRRPYSDFFKTTSVYNTPRFYNKAVYEDTAFHSFMFEINTFKDMQESADGARLSAWIAGFNYNSAAAGARKIRITPYYTEAMYHLGMILSESFIGYIVGPRDTDSDGYDYEDNMKVCSEILNELTRVAGYADRKSIPVATQWNSDFVLSGMYAGGRNIWRLTPDTSEGTSLEAFKVKDKAPTFKIGGQTVIFPQGRIIADGKVTHIGSCGYWIETPAGVTPVIINDTDRYENNPAYVEDFESYSANTAFNSATVLHKNAWETSGSLTVKSEGSDKALAMTGTASVKNVKIPQNITAGDSYAKQQVWEAKVTVPNSGDVILFSSNSADGGIKISGGKVYYDKSGAYAELSGVTLSAGSTYIIRREMDMRTANGFKSSYTVLDANGKRLGGADNVAINAFTLPGKTISISCSNVSGTAYIDDYTLRAVGVTTDFNTYDAATGMMQDDPYAARTKDTAYRLSWMNATAEHKVAKIYNNGNLVETVEMAPGADGVVTGIVKGSSKFTVATENGTATTLPNYDNGNFNWTVGDTGNGGNTDATTPSGGTDATNPDGTDATNPGGADATNPGGADATNPDGTGTNKPSDNKPGKTPSNNEKGLSGGIIALIVIDAIVVLAGGGFALYWFVIKPKRSAKAE